MSSERHERRSTHSKEDWKLKREIFKLQDNNSSGYDSDISLIEAADIKEGNHADTVAVNQQGSIDRKQSEASKELTKNSPDSTLLPCDEDAHTKNDLVSDGVYNIVSVLASEATEITVDEQCMLHRTCNDEYSVKCSEMRIDSNQEDNDDYTESDFKAFLTCTDNTKEADSGTDASKEQADDSKDVRRETGSSQYVSRDAGSSLDVNRKSDSSLYVSREDDSSQDVSREVDSDTDVSGQARSDTDIKRLTSSDTDISRQVGSDTDVSRDAVCDMVANRDVEHMKNLEEDIDSIADGDDYHVQQKEIEELEIVETHRPCLYSQKSTISTTSSQQNKVTIEKTHRDAVDSSKAERSERQRYKIEVS